MTDALSAPSAAPHDFYADHPTSSCNLIIGDNTLKVSSELLGMHSHFFRSLFFKVNPEYKGPVEERGEDGEKIVKPAVEPYDPLADTTPNLIRTEIKDVRLDNVKVKEVIDLLNIIYPSDAPITDANVSYIVELADKYLFNVIMHECEQHLTSTSELPKEDRLLLADKYHMCDLVDQIVKELTKTEIQNLINLKLSERTTKAMVKHLTAI
ncbi:hypothetical protein PRIPAC_86070 [Pristionchus pacificus]|uniref:BTB domain-containing protein n=1 Tax=Pristionchus pacificus TaxID=54126 RepID=A0A2A6BKU4_PRIPA|nr:hypothetical protein PRIPAC_86070 [Pristionchus pacificus]|eukprot:PDM66436.1 BTB domain-containing protein [Pristionchus pacificus]